MKYNRKNSGHDASKQILCVISWKFLFALSKFHHARTARKRQVIGRLEKGEKIESRTKPGGEYARSVMRRMSYTGCNLWFLYPLPIHTMYAWSHTAACKSCSKRMHSGKILCYFHIYTDVYILPIISVGYCNLYTTVACRPLHGVHVWAHISSCAWQNVVAALYCVWQNVVKPTRTPLA